MNILLASILCFTMTMTKPELIAETAVQIQTYPTEVTNELAAEEEVEEVPMVHLYGTCRVTFYCHCATCNGRAGAPCASGVMPTVNHTVATGSLPFGTRVMIDGVEYTVEDRGVGDFEMDIFVASHQEALNRGLYYTEVYIIDE